jgi:hypothetical protein
MLKGASKLVLLLNHTLKVARFSQQALPIFPQAQYFDGDNCQPSNQDSNPEYRVARRHRECECLIPWPNKDCHDDDQDKINQRERQPPFALHSSPSTGPMK